MTTDRFGRRDLPSETLRPPGATEPYVYAASWSSPARAATAWFFLEAQMAEFRNAHANPLLREHLIKVAFATGVSPIDHPENYGVNDNDLFANQVVQAPTVLRANETPVEAHRRLQAA